MQWNKWKSWMKWSINENVNTIIIEFWENNSMLPECLQSGCAKIFIFFFIRLKFGTFSLSILKTSISQYVNMII